MYYSYLEYLLLVHWLLDYIWYIQCQFLRQQKPHLSIITAELCQVNSTNEGINSLILYSSTSKKHTISILYSDIFGVHMDSTWSPCGVHVDSSGVQVESIV